MKAASPALIELLASGRPFLKADLYTIRLAGGTTLRYTSFDIALTFNGNTWLAGGPVFARTQTRTVIGLEVGTLNLSIAPKDSDTINGLPWFRAGCSGVLDDAVLTLDVAFLETPAAVVGTLRQFVGRFAPLSIDRGVLEVTCNSQVSLFDRKFPINLYQAGCVHTLYDADCGVSRNSYAVAGSVIASPTSQGFVANLAQGAGYFDTGALQFITGALAGLKRTVKRWDGTALSMLNPLPLAPAVNDTFTVWPGCARTREICAARFGNLPNFKGHPFVPVPETAV